MCVAHISGRYCFPVGSSRGWVIKDTPSVSVQLVGGVLTFDMQCFLCLPTITLNVEVTHFSTSRKLSDGRKNDPQLGFSLGLLQN